MLTKSTQPKINFLNPKLIIYTVVIFLVLVTTAEAIARTPHFQSSQYVLNNPLTLTSYYPAARHFEQIQQYISENGNPQCIFLGNSLTQTGINPEIFARAFQETTGDPIRCYNAGMDGSTLSSTAPMALLFAQRYHPSYIVVGIQVNQFLRVDDQNPSHLAEDVFHHYGWLEYKLGHFNLEGWLIENSQFYSALMANVPAIFSSTDLSIDVPASSEDRIRPAFVKRWYLNGYAPLLEYRDGSPIFQNDAFEVWDGIDVDPQDIAALEQLMDHAKNGEFNLIIVKMPVDAQTTSTEKILSPIELLVRQNGVPFLSTDGLAPLPKTAYSDQIHMHITGSFMFSQWLGTQIGQAILNEALANLDDPIWSPTLATWDDYSGFETTLGLNQNSYERYLAYQDNFTLVPQDAIIFNPSSFSVDRTFTQSLVGFAVDWVGGISDQERLDLFQFMIILEHMKYQDELRLSTLDREKIEAWKVTLDPSILSRQTIQYVLCREEFANPTLRHCPPNIANNPDYVLIGTWKLYPLYEQYVLYRVDN